MLSQTAFSCQLLTHIYINIFLFIPAEGTNTAEAKEKNEELMK